MRHLKQRTRIRCTALPNILDSPVIRQGVAPGRYNTPTTSILLAKVEIHIQIPVQQGLSDIDSMGEEYIAEEGVIQVKTLSRRNIVQVIPGRESEILSQFEPAISINIHISGTRNAILTGQLGIEGVSLEILGGTHLSIQNRNLDAGIIPFSHRICHRIG